jgi:hypothetical protein
MLDPDRIEERRGHAGNHEEFILVVVKAAESEGIGSPCPHPIFDRKINPLSTRGTNYTHRILIRIKILVSDFQTFLRPCLSKQKKRTRRIPLSCKKASVSSLVYIAKYFANNRNPIEKKQQTFESLNLRIKSIPKRNY